MTSLYPSPLLGADTESNITTRRSTGLKKSKMASEIGRADDLQRNGSLFIDSILSQDEASEVISMFDMANELKGGFGLTGFCTSTQMTRTDVGYKSLAPPLSPISSQKEAASYDKHGGTGGNQGAITEDVIEETIKARNERNSAGRDSNSVLLDPRGKTDRGRKMDGENGAINFRDSSSVTKELRTGGNVTNVSDEIDPVVNSVVDPDGRGKHDPVTESSDNNVTDAVGPEVLNEADGGLGEGGQVEEESCDEEDKSDDGYDKDEVDGARAAVTSIEDLSTKIFFFFFFFFIQKFQAYIQSLRL